MSRPNVWLVRRKGKRGPTYSIRWIDPRSGRCRSTSCGRDKVLARRLQRQKLEQLARGIAGDAIDVSWSDFVDEELDLARGRMAATSIRRLETSLNALTQLCDPPSVGVVDYRLLEQFVASRSAKRRPATVKGDLSYIRASLRRACKRGYIAVVPEIPRVVVPETALRVLSATEIESLVNACLDDRQRVFVWLSLTLGTRLGETLNLRWQDVLLEDGLVRIECRGDWQTKTRRNRVCYLDPRGVELLRSVHASVPKIVASGQVVPKLPWVFISNSGERWGQNIQRTWRGIIKRAGIPHAGIHTMRRTFVSGLVAVGVQQSIVTKVAGHQSPNTTYRYYTNVPSESCREAVSRLPWVADRDAERYANSAHAPAQGA